MSLRFCFGPSGSGKSHRIYEEIMQRAAEELEEALDGCLSKNISDWGKIKSTIKDALGDYVWKKTKRRPMILPIIMEA